MVDPVIDPFATDYVVGTLTWEEALEEMKYIVEDLTLEQIADLEIEAYTQE